MATSIALSAAQLVSAAQFKKNVGTPGGLPPSNITKLYFDSNGQPNWVDSGGMVYNFGSPPEIGGGTPAQGTFTTLNATTVNANSSLVANSADINGGTIDNTAIGDTTPAAGTFTSIDATGTATLATVDIDAGAIDGTIIGANAAAAGTFSSLLVNGGEIDLNRVGDSAGAYLRIDGDNGFEKMILFREGGTNLWRIGSPTDVSFSIQRYVGGSFQDVAFGISNASGNVTVANDLEINGALNHDGSTIGVFGTTPTTKQTVTGSRGGNAALASLLTALAAYGLITDSSS